nr:MAG TPA: replication protein [Inoviridae sp.]
MNSNINNALNQEVTKKLSDRKTRTMKLYKRVFPFDFKSASRFYNCGTQIALQNGMIKSANFCRDRLCPMCSYRRAQKMFSQNMAVYDKIKAENPGYRQLFLTLTVPNVKLWQLKDTLRKMSDSWNRLRNHRAFKREPVVGYCKKLEITYNKEQRTYHPHYHVMLTVDGWASDIRDYVSWWSASCQLGRQLVCWIEAVDGDARSVSELSKYMTKSDDILESLSEEDGTTSEEKWFMYRAAVFAVREMTYGGVWRVYRRELGFVDIEDDDLTDVEKVTHSEEPIYWLEWQHQRACYVVVDVVNEWCLGDIIANDLALLKRKNVS